MFCSTQGIGRHNAVYSQGDLHVDGHLHGQPSAAANANYRTAWYTAKTTITKLSTVKQQSFIYTHILIYAIHTIALMKSVATSLMQAANYMLDFI